jgi:hypothetical protein
MPRRHGIWLLALGILLGAVAASAEGGGGGMTMKSPHKGNITKGLDCSACHSTGSWDLLGGKSSGESGFDHARTGFPLTGRHRHAACTDCHTGEVKVRRDCASCHADPHGRRLGQQCDRCHNSVTWRSVRAIERHRLTRLPLTGMHALLDCTECHQRIGDRQWSSAPANCYACHAKDYRRGDVHPRHTGDANNPPFPHDCTQCHRATGWSPAVITSATFALNQALSAPRHHDLSFPITFGKHRGAQCSSCHVSLARPKIVRCDGCHAHDPIRVRRQHRRVHAAVGGSCLGCHPGGARR